MKEFKLQDAIALTKPRIVFMVLVMTGGAMALAPQFDEFRALLTMIATALIVASANVFNMYLERETDGLMARTRNRPLPSGRMSARSALGLGIVLGVVSLLGFWVLDDGLVMGLAVISWGLYVALYTPLKRVTPWALVIGAVPGAMPPLIGWVAMLGEFSAAGNILFLIVFFWQMPHFLAISIYCFEDYQRAGIQTVAHSWGIEVAKWQALMYTLALIGTSFLLITYDVASWAYGICAACAGLLYLVYAVKGWTTDKPVVVWARHFFRSSLVYLPLIVLGLILDQVF